MPPNPRFEAVGPPVLPNLMVPREQAVPFLREAAARFQADLVFIFRPDCQTFRRWRLLAEERVRATCTVEAVLLDTRTGIVPSPGPRAVEGVERPGTSLTE